EQSRRLEKLGEADAATTLAARGHAYRAWGLNKLGRKVAAADAGRKAVELNPTEAKYHRLLGECLREFQPENALAAFRAALKLDRAPLVNDQQAVGELLRELERPDEALKVFEALLERNPQDERAHRAIGRVLLETGRLKEAAV